MANCLRSPARGIMSVLDLIRMALVCMHQPLHFYNPYRFSQTALSASLNLGHLPLCLKCVSEFGASGDHAETLTWARELDTFLGWKSSWQELEIWKRWDLDRMPLPAECSPHGIIFTFLLISVILNVKPCPVPWPLFIFTSNWDRWTAKGYNDYSDEWGQCAQ